MPAKKRYGTKYPGVYFIKSTAVSDGRPETIFYIRYRRAGKMIEEKAGRQYQDDMTAAKANALRVKRLEGAQLSNEARREAEKLAKAAEDSRWTVSKLFTAYKEAKPNLKGWSHGTYDSLWDLHVEPYFGHREPKDILPLDVKRIENKLLKTKSPQMVAHALKLLRTLCNFGRDNHLCPGLQFTIKMPTVDNCKTEDLTSEQLQRLLDAIDKDDHPQAGPMMLMALYTGMRAGELMRLQWDHVNFQKGFIRLVDPKGGVEQTIPLNASAKKLLEEHPKRKGSPYVFPGRKGEQRTRIDKATKAIGKAAGLPAGFRPLHGLRHVYASMLASSGAVDLYVLQRLLTHKDPKMTQRYAHLRDDALRRASDLAGDIVASMTTQKVNMKE